MDVAPKEKTYTVGEAKERLRRVSARFDPFAVVRRKPLHATGRGLPGRACLGGVAPWRRTRAGEPAALGRADREPGDALGPAAKGCGQLMCKTWTNESEPPRKRRLATMGFLPFTMKN